MTYKNAFRLIKDNKGFILFILSMAAFRTAIADWNYVPSESMEPTFYDQEYLLVNKLAYGPAIPFTKSRLFHTGTPKRGDIITFYPPHEELQFVKRVIATPGDIVQIEGNSIYVNNSQLSFSQASVENNTLFGSEKIDSLTHAVQYTREHNIPVFSFKTQVPEGKYFVMGDNRNNSVDSRFWGFVDENKIMGKVTHIAVSFSGDRPLLQRIGTRLN
ncbi:MAG: signal peptidase I [Agarilytica sp.]